MSELDRFREEWRKEVEARQRGVEISKETVKTTPSVEKRQNRHPIEDRLETPSYGGEETPSLPETPIPQTPDLATQPKPDSNQAKDTGSEIELSHDDARALESFELAVDHEHVGRMGDAVKHYRDAFRINHRVDKLYRQKYFAKAKPYQPPPPQSDGDQDVIEMLEKTTLEDQKDSSEGNEEVEEDIVEGPLMHMPAEILERILATVALADLSSFTRCTYTCKKLAFVGYTSTVIWKRLCLKEYSRQHYTADALEEITPDIDMTLYTSIQRELLIASKVWNHAWRQMYLERPRVWFNGVYISTCNYLRPGVGESWNNPIHMVTYYRYLRFFEDGTCISLLTVDEPKEVVPLFNRHVLGSRGKHDHAHHLDRAQQGGPPISGDPLKTMVFGTWAIDSADGRLLIETEGSVDRYLFYMSLHIRSSGKNKHNKLKWIRFWSVNKLSQNEGEFSLKNDKAYFFVRTRQT